MFGKIITSIVLAFFLLATFVHFVVPFYDFYDVLTAFGDMINPLEVGGAYV